MSGDGTAGLSDRGAVGLAVSAWIGAATGVAVAVPVAVGASLLALALRRVPVILVASFVLAGAMAHAAGLTPAAEVAEGELVSAMKVVSDPVKVARGARLDAELGEQRYELLAFGPAGAKLRDRLAGEVVEIRGTARPVLPGSWAARRGVAGAVAVDEVLGHHRASGHERLANDIRRLLDRGSVSLAVDDQALFLGVLFGDDRDLSTLVGDDFRAAGLTHLVAVSGQNVAFVLMVFGPLLRRLGPWGRWATVLGVLAVFGTITRFEPSVLRATAMAAVAATATALGREASGTRTLSLAVAALVTFDPSLVHQLGFRLSVSATAGILWISPWIARNLLGPRVFREALAVTAGAQLAVAPMLVLTFGGIPVASLPANLAAGPVAAPLMVWGLTGGVLAGLAPPGLASMLHWPTAALTGWLRLVARLSAMAPLGRIGPIELFGGGTVVALLFAARRRGLAWFVALGVMTAPSLVFVAPTRGRFELAPGVELWRADITLVELEDQAQPDRVLSSLREAGVADIDLVVLATGAAGEHRTAALLGARHRIGAVWEPMDLGEGAVVGLGALAVARAGGPDEARLEVSLIGTPP